MSLNETQYKQTHGGVFYTYKHKMHTKMKCVVCKEEITLGSRYWTREKGKEIHTHCLDTK